MHRPSAHITRQGAADTLSGAPPTAASQFQPSARPVPAIVSPATARTRRSPTQDRYRPVLSGGGFAISMLCMARSIFARAGNTKSWSISALRLDRRIDLGRSLPDLVNLQGTGFLARHPRCALGHPRQRDPGDLRLFGKQAVDDLDRDMTADDVAPDQRDVAGLPVFGGAGFLAPDGQIVR